MRPLRTFNCVKNQLWKFVQIVHNFKFVENFGDIMDALETGYQTLLASYFFSLPTFFFLP